jgi:hypothetical protein
MLGQNNLSGSVPAELAVLSDLQHLNLSFNNLTGPLPSTWTNLTSLKTLRLSNNPIGVSCPC